MLTQKVREQPFSVILLDEFEKAHPNIFDLFLQVFDDGRLTDARGRTADFRHTIVIMTSNLGSGIGIGQSAMGFGDHGDDVPSEEKVLREVRKFFRPEFVNRIDRIVVFKPLSSDVMRKIVRRELGKVVLRSGILRRHLLVDMDPDVVDLLMAQGFSQAYGARPLKRRVEQLVLLPLAREIVSMGDGDKGALLQVFVEDRGPEVAGGKVAIRRHKTREASRKEQVAERLKLRAPDGEKVIGVKPTELAGILEKLGERVARLRRQAESGRYTERKSEIVAETATPTFWDDPQRARRRLAELAHLEDLLESLDAGSRQLDDVADFARAYQRHGQSIRARFEEAYATFLDRLVALEYKFLGESDEDRQDVFLALKRIGDGKEAAEAVETMQKMYLAWAERRGFGVSWLHRRDDDHGPLESTWLLEGISLYGLLKGEDGLHRFELGGKGENRRAAFIRADVLPRSDGERRIARKDVRVEKSPRELVLVHAPTGTSVEASGEAIDEDALYDLLDARVADRTKKRDADRLVRRYNIEGKFIRDEETGVKAGHRDLLAGGLDELLRARLLGQATPSPTT
jgi:ATP-dependent Clp protease ATP-binding subunit ClpC